MINDCLILNNKQFCVTQLSIYIGENMKQDILNITEYKDQLRKFAGDRDWDKFHNPKNLVMALNVESAELCEIFQWLTQEEAANLNDETKKKVAYEIADILVYAMRLADKIDINLDETIKEKLIHNAEKYPVEKCKGKSLKYNELK
jgi:dCTP diphosphatase